MKRRGHDVYSSSKHKKQKINWQQKNKSRLKEASMDAVNWTKSYKDTVRWRRSKVLIVLWNPTVCAGRC